MLFFLKLLKIFYKNVLLLKYIYVYTHSSLLHNVQVLNKHLNKSRVFEKYS